MAQPSRSDIANVILSLSKKLSGKALAEAIAAYLTEQRRTSELDAILREVSRLRERQEGVTEATVTSAHPLTDKVERQLKEILGEKIIINSVVDKNVIGGVRVETNDISLDLTVRNRLDQLKTSKQGVIN